MWHLLADSVTWFPQERANDFQTIKGLLSLVATLALLWHMAEEWSASLTWGRRLRYLSLLVFAVVVTGSSVEQVAAGVPVTYGHLGGMVATLVLLVAMAVSITEADRPKP